MEKSNFACGDELPQIYVGGKEYKPSRNFTFEAVYEKDRSYTVMADNAVCDTCSNILHCTNFLMKELCESQGNAIVDDFKDA